MNAAAMKRPITTEQMLAELSVTFPALWKRPLVDFGRAGREFAAGEGVWTGQDTPHVMQDGLPIFDATANGGEPYDGSVHGAFLSWLDLRGRYCERYDGETYFLVPDQPDEGAT